MEHIGLSLCQVSRKYIQQFLRFNPGRTFGLADAQTQPILRFHFIKKWSGIKRGRWGNYNKVLFLPSYIIMMALLLCRHWSWTIRFLIFVLVWAMEGPPMEGASACHRSTPPCKEGSPHPCRLISLVCTGLKFPVFTLC